MVVIRMSTEVKVPAVGESISSGILSVWHKADGDSVESGEILFTLETDKVSTEVNAPESGTLQVLAEEGEEVKIGQVVAKIEAGSAPKTSEASKEKPTSKSKPESKSKEEEPEQGLRREESEPVPPSGPLTKAVKTPSAESSVGESVRKRGSEGGGSGDTSGRTTRKKLTPLRRKIATQLVMAQHNAAILTTFNECDMSSVMALRKEMQDEFVSKNGVKLGFMSFFIKAVVDALKAVPGINARMDGDELVMNHYYDIGVAVGTDRGLVVPVVRDCDEKSFGEIENDLAQYAVRAREGKIALDDLQGGVFSISNGGIYGSLLSTPILNPPQSGILGMHKIQERPVAVEGRVEIRPMMYLALSYDHRVVDGKEAVTFLVRVKECIENPARLLLGV
jgi:2-oxoglutarate dehydrogenase E2 component (dihydrolipoamide succinyltransferase)